jgi:hypothetical protein
LRFYLQISTAIKPALTLAPGDAKSSIFFMIIWCNARIMACFAGLPQWHFRTNNLRSTLSLERMHRLPQVNRRGDTRHRTTFSQRPRAWSRHPDCGGDALQIMLKDCLWRNLHPSGGASTIERPSVFGVRSATRNAIASCSRLSMQHFNPVKLT